ncbi:MAG TPA: RagB/SusD family nutrient uptake outer membrane protein, partial [Gemmatimonadaceae bacterium]|nr:RagB/SusD family nutrient uptake outer membrane protein [Gemmatimonadaceae bacterium]
EVETGDLAGATALVNQIRTRAGVKAQGPGTNRATMAIAINDPSITWASYKVGLYPVFTDQTYARNAVQTERRLELAMEGQRFFDLRRYGTVADVINSYLTGAPTVSGGAENTRIIYKSKAEPITARHRWYAIPNTQIQLSKTGATNNLKQNPGW